MAIHTKTLGIYQSGYNNTPNLPLAPGSSLKIPNNPFPLKEEVINSYYKYLPEETQLTLNKAPLTIKTTKVYTEE
jgi:hypothetical protein